MATTRPLALPLVGLVLALACQPPPPSVDPAEAQTPAQPAVFTEQQVAEAPEPQEPEDVPAIEAGTCPAAVSYVPTPYFDEQLLIRLPAGVDESALTEVTPGLARTSGPVELASCDEAQPVTIDFIGLTLLPDDANMSLTKLRGLTLDAMGYPATDSTLIQRDLRDEREGVWVYEVPGTANADQPARVLIAFKALHGLVAALVYEVQPEQWPLIVDTLVESSDRVSLLPPSE